MVDLYGKCGYIYHSHGSLWANLLADRDSPHEFEAAAIDHQGESHLLGMSLGTRIFRKDLCVFAYVFKVLPLLRVCLTLFLHA